MRALVVCWSASRVYPHLSRVQPVNPLRTGLTRRVGPYLNARVNPRLTRRVGPYLNGQGTRNVPSACLNTRIYINARLGRVLECLSGIDQVGEDLGTGVKGLS